MLRGLDLQNAVQWLAQSGANKEPKPTLLQQQYVQASQQWEAQEVQRLKDLYEKTLARQLAAQSELIRNEHANLLPRSVLLAVESMKRFASVEAEQSLRRGLALLPRSVCCIKHNSQVTAVTFSLDGKYLATACWSDDPRICEAISGREITKIPHTHRVLHIAFSPDGRYFATASKDKIVRIWEVTDGRLKLEVGRVYHKDRIQAISFSPDGKYLAIASNDYTAVIWETTDRREIARIEHKSFVEDIAFSSNEKYLATASSDNTARICKAHNGKKVLTLRHALV
ncbi:hypothetical protein L0337_41680 [candidate division KSB1 bacterium]|nr:hypothetical protein [candidate division KSB1 bacterium]